MLFTYYVNTALCAKNYRRKGQNRAGRAHQLGAAALFARLAGEPHLGRGQALRGAIPYGKALHLVAGAFFCAFEWRLSAPHHKGLQHPVRERWELCPYAIQARTL